MLPASGANGFLGGEVHTQPELNIAFANALGVVQAAMIGIVVE